MNKAIPQNTENMIKRTWLTMQLRHLQNDVQTMPLKKL